MFSSSQVKDQQEAEKRKVTSQEIQESLQVSTTLQWSPVVPLQLEIVYFIWPYNIHGI